MSDDFNPRFAQINTAAKRPRHESEINDSLAVGLPSTAKKVLMLAPLLAGGSAVDGELVEGLASPDAVKDAVGVVGYQMAEILFKGNTAPQLDLLAIAEAGAGTAASGTITFATNAAKDGSFELYFGDYKIDVDALEGDTPAEVASAAFDAIIADTLCEWTATDPAAGAELTYTHKLKGTLGNYVRVAVVMPSGIGMTAAVVQPTSGATDPTFSSTYAAKFQTRNYDAIVVPWRFTSASLTALKAAVAQMRAPGRIVDARFFIALSDTYAQSVTYQTGIEDHDVVLLWQKAAARYPTPPHRRAAYEVGIFTSEANPAVPFIEDPRPALMAPFETAAVEPTDAEIENCMSHGLTCDHLRDDGTLEVVQLLTSQTKLSTGVASDAWASIHVPVVLKYFRRAVDARLRSVYSSREGKMMIPGRMADVRAQVLAVADELAAPPRYYLDGDYLAQNRDKIVVEPIPGNESFLGIGLSGPVLRDFKGTLSTYYLVVPIPQT